MASLRGPFRRVFDNLIRLAEKTQRVREQLGVPPRPGRPDLPPRPAEGQRVTADYLGQAVIAIMKELMGEIEHLKRSGKLVPGDDRLDLMEEMEALGRSLKDLPAEGPSPHDPEGRDVSSS